MFLHQARGSAGAKFSLAGTHAHAGATAEVYEVVYVQLVDGIVDLAHRDLLAFADQRVAVGIIALDVVGHRTVASLCGLLLCAEFYDMLAPLLIVCRRLRTG